MGVKSDAGRDTLLKQSSTIVTVDPMEQEDIDLGKINDSSNFKPKVFKEKEKALEDPSEDGSFFLLILMF